MSASRIDRIDAFDDKKEQWRVIIETPKGSRNKYNFDVELGQFVLGSVLPEGMSFPYDFGFLPSTVGEDGDPLDVLVLMDEPAFSGCVIPVRLVGVIEAEQTEHDGEAERNDRLVAVPVKCQTYSDCESLKDLNESRVREIQNFFISYNRVREKKFKVLDVCGPKRAEELARSGMKKSSKLK